MATYNGEYDIWLDQEEAERSAEKMGYSTKGISLLPTEAEQQQQHEAYMRASEQQHELILAGIVRPLKGWHW